ncbi:holin-like protein [Alteribacillus persepolensis]|uniref:Holin-like protein n=1 Tax=Alteribacillus persepolensis TaxID=568899 RepID=A0A1G8E465_9BACI|nr:CidA/LrgA family protein [Alteribacillus persepolensis]SDH64645.1 holin-like protein [Alteribacillus persepolensis]
MMDILRIMLHIGILYLFYYAGVWIQEQLNLIIPGSIIGMLLLLLCFYFKLIKPKWVELGTSMILGHMPLLFMPVTAGTIVYVDLFAGAGMWLVVIAFASTLIVIIVTGKTAQFFAKRREEHG